MGILWYTGGSFHVAILRLDCLSTHGWSCTGRMEVWLPHPAVLSGFSVYTLNHDGSALYLWSTFLHYSGAGQNGCTGRGIMYGPGQLELCRCLTIAALLFCLSALSTNPNQAGEVSGCFGGWVTSWTQTKLTLSLQLLVHIQNEIQEMGPYLGSFCFCLGLCLGLGREPLSAGAHCDRSCLVLARPYQPEQTSIFSSAALTYQRLG